jgi:ferritin-like metal-binding protein YciE
MHSLNILYLEAINNLFDIEDQLINAIPKLIELSHEPELKKTLTQHLEETKLEKVRLDEILTHHSIERAYERDMAIEMLLHNAENDLSLIEEPAVKDAFIVASALTIEYIEIARYRTLVRWAKELGDDFGIELLQKTLSEEENAAATLTALADGNLLKRGINENASLTHESDHTSI